MQIKNLKDFALLAEAYISMRGQTAQINQLQKVLGSEQRRAMLDPLTQTWNRLGLSRLYESWKAAEEKGRVSIGIAYCDLDHFKSVNDRYGHAVGDQILQGAAKALGGALRDGDLLARFGGEEFVALIKLESVLEIQRIGERLRAAVENATELMLPQTISIGTAVLDNSESFEQALHRADQAMYQAKRNGRNRVVSAAPFPNRDAMLAVSADQQT